jgi:hypothetical protein
MRTVQANARSLTVLEQDKPPTVETLGQEPPRRRSWLAGALVIVALVIAGLGGWPYTDHHHRSSAEQAAATTVSAWLDAFYAHDAATVWSLSSRAWTWESGGGVSGQGGPYTGTELLGMISSDWKVNRGQPFSPWPSRSSWVTHRSPCRSG